MFDDHDGVSGLDESPKRSTQQLDICHVQARRRLIEQKQMRRWQAIRQKTSQFETLALTSRQRRGRLPEAQIPETGINEVFESLLQILVTDESPDRRANRQIQGLRYVETCRYIRHRRSKPWT